MWPEVLRVIHDANIRNYSTFLKEPENLLFADWIIMGAISMQTRRRCSHTPP